MHYHLILTEKCNLQCRYCYGKSNKPEEFDNQLEERFNFDFSDPCTSQVDIEKLKEFLLQDSNPVLIFYGGEPLLQIEKITKIMDSLQDTNVKFRMQTNGVLLDRIPMKYLNKIGKILVSLDGNKERTDLNRGEGNFEKVYSNINKIKEQGYSGEIIARMTLTTEEPRTTDIYEQVINLINLGFTSIHWQLDVGFYQSDYEKEKVETFFKEYNESISKLIDWWLQELKKGNIYRLYPFLGIIKPLLNNGESMENISCGLRCGAGNKGYAISTSGKIVACPIMNNIEDFKAGDINSKTETKDLKKFDCLNECKDCEVYGLCGGRCLYWRKAKLWPEEGDKMICNSIKHYINELKSRFPEIREEIEKENLKKEEFDYEDYFGPESIP